MGFAFQRIWEHVGLLRVPSAAGGTGNIQPVTLVLCHANFHAKIISSSCCSWETEGFNQSSRAGVQAFLEMKNCKAGGKKKKICSESWNWEQGLACFCAAGVRCVRLPLYRSTLMALLSQALPQLFAITCASCLRAFLLLIE